MILKYIDFYFLFKLEISTTCNFWKPWKLYCLVDSCAIKYCLFKSHSVSQCSKCCLLDFILVCPNIFPCCKRTRIMHYCFLSTVYWVLINLYMHSNDNIEHLWTWFNYESISFVRLICKGAHTKTKCNCHVLLCVSHSIE